MPRAGRNGRRKGRGKRGLASCSLRPKGRDLDVVAALSTRRKERRIAWFLEEGKSKGGKEGKRKTKRGKERRRKGDHHSWKSPLKMSQAKPLNFFFFNFFNDYRSIQFCIYPESILVIG